MLNKVAINKNEIDKLIKLKRYDEAKNYILDVRNMIDLVSTTRVNKFIENKIILEKEREVFHSLIENNINKKLLEEKNVILIDESYVEIFSEKINKMKSLRERRKVSNR